MTENRRRKQDARAYQREHGSDYTDARRATERSPSRGRRQRAAATLAVREREVHAGLARAVNRPPLRDPFVQGLVDSMLEELDALPDREDISEGGIWSIVMSGGWATVGEVESPALHALADRLTALVGELDDPQLVAAATDLWVTQNDIGDLSREAFNNTDDGTGRPRVIEALISPRKPGAMNELHKEQLRVQASLEAHLRDASGATWDEFARMVLRQSVLAELAGIGDSYLSASGGPESAALGWRRLADGSMRADIDIPGRAKPVTALVKMIATAEPASIARLGHEFVTAFYKPERTWFTDRYVCYVGEFDGAGNESDVDLMVLEDFRSPVPAMQLSCQHEAAEVIAEMQLIAIGGVR
jgi:hypothetical protein